ncbi:asparagine synthase (glutamine-hydrolyzing) [Chengkuizengella axinellae]|uniref:asparagine synthase (glutamine-hydrolyzing) n=1 Tax=Chengkuizengella axinellae TaxID=3064388 RepID=A0ABT9J210_9BACL|nr:asparagine synthase (glutamine-hydrolyzing) [Chengkuizengella sp. 2205SS18-9]MDP5275649.1 asparagine synthase (glutamine-hydrolyzing) [Chengkuizengella sp. 2205SS18-9]
MCGIAGLLYFDDREPSHDMLNKMANVMIHRGPDDCGYWSDNAVGLAFRRLSIIDLKEGHQPLSNEDESVWIIFNGEIYNYKQLRKDLKERGHQFKTNTDTEVIVHLYEEYGEGCVHYLRGMFAFVIWDRNKQLLFGARDHFGIKPFYYYRNEQQFIFGSEIKSILTVDGFEGSVDHEALFQYLTFQYVPEPKTMFKGIFKLPPAHTIKVSSNGKILLKKYWDPSFEPKQRPLEEFIEETRERMKDSVIHHMQSDVHRGCFLSSGIDSTAIAAYMKSVEPIKTFSVGFEGPNNETLIAQQTADYLGTDHYSKMISMEDFFESVPKAIWNQDEPVADPSAVALYHVAKLAKEHVKVVLSGEGADELFGGYRIYREPQALQALSWLPMKSLLNRIFQMLPKGMKGKNYLLRATTPLEQRFIGNAKIFSEDLKGDILNIGEESLHLLENSLQIANRFYQKTKHLDPVSRMQYIDLNLWMPGDILMKADKMTMAHSLELRVPFLDKELFELTRQIPVNYRISEGTTKYVLRKAMEGIIPNFITNRPKLGFPVPLRDWLKHKQGDIILEQILSSDIEPYINLEYVEKMLREHRNGNGDYSRKIWTIYVFALWYETYLSSSKELSPVFVN